METQLTNDDDFGDAGASFDFLDFQTQGDEQTQDFQGGEEDEVNYDEGVGMVQDTGGHGSAAMDFPNRGHARAVAMTAVALTTMASPPITLLSAVWTRMRWRTKVG